MALYNFSANDFSPQYGGGGSLPVGKHPVMIVETELAASQGNTGGGFLAITLEAVDGPAKGIRHTDRLNLRHSNPVVVEIANKQLSAYCYVTGVMQFKDTNELCRRPFVVEITPQKNKPEYTEVSQIFTSDMRKPGEVAAAGGQPVAKAAVVIPEKVAVAAEVAQAEQGWGTQATTTTPPWGA